VIRYIFAGLWVLAVLVVGAAPAHAGPDGAIPAPGLCDYPAVCTSGAAFGEYDYADAFPTEINGSHRQCLLGGAMFQGTAGVSIMFINASITTPLGVIRGACWYACPDPMLSLAETPNPPGAWKNYLKPTKCKPIGPAPLPIKPPDAAAPINESVTPPGGLPLIPGPAIPAAPPPLLPNQTNPGAASPFQPEDHN
jgi:hypothetical protein